MFIILQQTERENNLSEAYSGWLFQLSLEVLPPLMFPMTVTPLGRDQDCSLKNREPDGPAPWFLDPGGWSKTTAVRLFFIFPGICTLSLKKIDYDEYKSANNNLNKDKHP
ncbi:hypothetical protein STEG23_013683 [Scotinomys teguina]